MQLTLIGRSYCHLCDEMRVAVESALHLAGRSMADTILSHIDLDDFPALETRYGEWVPVLLLGTLDDGVEICHYHFDHAKWAALMSLPVGQVS